MKAFVHTALPGRVVFGAGAARRELAGEIERLGAFGRAGAKARGWKRVVAIILVVGMVEPFLIALVVDVWAAVH